MTEAIEIIQYKNHKIEIFKDEAASSPRENDNICEFHCHHNNYLFGDKNYNTESSDMEQYDNVVKDAVNNKDIVLPLYLYDHGGITISLSPFNCPWDSGQVGVVIIPRKKMLEEFSAKTFHKALKDKALKIAEAEVNEMDQYLTGDIYGYSIDGGEESCWGYYGQSSCIAEAKNIVDHMEKVQFV